VCVRVCVCVRESACGAAHENHHWGRSDAVVVLSHSALSKSGPAQFLFQKSAHT